MGPIQALTRYWISPCSIRFVTPSLKAITSMKCLRLWRKTTSTRTLIFWSHFWAAMTTAAS